MPLTDGQFVQLLQRFADFDLFSRNNTPVIFIVYAHENEVGEAKADVVKFVIECFNAVRARVISDKFPLLSNPKDIDPLPAGDILHNQFRLLPSSGNDQVRKVVLCGSQVLQKYSKHACASEYIKSIEILYKKQAERQQFQDRVKELVQERSSEPWFHHVLTELAFLQIRKAVYHKNHGIIPVALSGGDIRQYLPIVEMSNVFIELRNNDARKLIFKLLKRIYESRLHDAAINEIDECYHELQSKGEISHDLSHDEAIYRSIFKISEDHTAAVRSRTYIHDDLEAKLNQCLLDLRLSDPSLDKLTIESRKGGLLKDLSRWIFKDEDFRKWRKDQNSQLLWIKGDPGKGKTMLLCHIADELSRSNKNGDLVAYFFCQATNEKMNNATAVLRGLIYMLAKQDNSLLGCVYDKYKTAGKGIFTDDNAWVALRQVFESLMQNYGPNRLVLIIDALDECSQDQSSLLDFIVEKSGTSRVKWLVSSRTWPQIGEALATANLLSLELNRKAVTDAVSSYISLKVDELRIKKNFDEKTREAIISFLRKNSGDTFLWVAIVCERLKTTQTWQLLTELKHFPAGLNSLYGIMMESIRHSRNEKLFHYILATVSVVYQPITLLELWTFIGDLPQLKDANFVHLEAIVRGCGSLLTVQEDRIYFVHQSAKDYLITNATHTIFHGNVKATHFSIYSKSIDALSVLHRDMYDLKDAGVSINEIHKPSPDPLAHLRYSCLHWVDHLRDGVDTSTTIQPGEEVQDGGAVQSFLEKRYLPWLESPSLLGHVPKGISSMIQLSRLLEGTEKTTSLAKLIYDALRFIQSHSVLITQNPLQLYASALVFSPESSRIRALFREEEPAWIGLKPTVDKTWNSYMQTLEGHDDAVKFVIFSPDSRIVASASYDRTIRLWSVESGTLIHTLQYDSALISMTFSPDSRAIITISNNTAIQIWSTETGHLQHSLMRASDSWADSAAYSLDGSMVAYGLRDNTLILWSTKTRVVDRTLTGHHGTIHSIVFSPDCRTVASSSLDGTIRLWYYKTGVLCRVLKPSRARAILLVRFSPDGKIMASGSDDGTVLLWSTVDGKLLHTYTPIGDEIISFKIHFVAFSFSPDSKVLAVSSGYDDTELQLGSVETGVLQHRLGRHGCPVSSVAFSPDGKVIASGSYDKTVRLWSTEAAALQQTLERQNIDHSDKITSIALSPDGKVVASKSDNDVVQLWSSETGLLLHTLEHHPCQFKGIPVIFSPNSKVVALISGAISLWSVEKGELLHVLGEHSASTSAAFSSDGAIIASRSSKKSIQLWRTAAGLPLHDEISVENYWFEMLSLAIIFSPDDKFVASLWGDTAQLVSTQTYKLQHSFSNSQRPITSLPSITSMAFSPDGKTIALSSASGDTIRLWSIETGELMKTIVFRDRFCANAIGFSHDGEVIAASLPNTLRLLSSKTGVYFQSISIRLTSDNLSFENHGKCIDSGSIIVDCSHQQAVSGQHSLIGVATSSIGYGISTDSSWITWNGKKLMWLPAQYRPGKFIISGATMVFCSLSGKLTVMKCSKDGPIGIARVESTPIRMRRRKRN